MATKQIEVSEASAPQLVLDMLRLKLAKFLYNYHRTLPKARTEAVFKIPGATSSSAEHRLEAMKRFVHETHAQIFSYIFHDPPLCEPSDSIELQLATYNDYIATALDRVVAVLRPRSQLPYIQKLMSEYRAQLDQFYEQLDARRHNGDQARQRVSRDRGKGRR